MDIYEKKGYLNSEFRLFHLTGKESLEIKTHYHDFDKITIFLKGRVSYIIEGKNYDHSQVYDRIIVYISPNFTNAYKTDDYDLNYCFQKARAEHSNVLRIPSLEKSSLFSSIVRLEHSFSDNGYAAGLYRQVLFLEFMVHLNRAAFKNRLEFLDTENHSKVAEILQYINDNLTEDLSIGHIADTFFISKYYMMRQFKQETGLHLPQTSPDGKRADPVRHRPGTGML